MPSSLHLARVRLKNFKNIQIDDDGLHLRNLNLLIGPNGSGKSNLIGVLKFLKEALTFETITSQGVSAFERALLFLGYHHILDGTKTIPASVHFGFDFDGTGIYRNGLHYEFELMVHNLRSIVLWGERLKESASPDPSFSPFVYYEQADRSPIGNVFFFENDAREDIQTAHLENLPLDRLTLQMLPEVLEEKGLSPDLTPVYKARRQLIEALADWQFYNANDMNLRNIRESEPKTGPADLFVSPSGENLPIVFHNLYQNHIDFEDRINDAMRSVLPGTRKIRVVSSGRYRLTIEWHMEGMAEPLYLNDMSDGSVRMLCWAIILLSPEPPSLLVIDEPEIGLHPAWMKTLADWIETAAGKTQVIITTHSPDLLDRFTHRSQDILCFTFDGQRHFLPERLSEAALAAKLADGWELGDLYRVGDPAIGAWPW